MLGQKFLAEARKYFKTLDDDFTRAYLNDLGQYLIRPLETKPFPFSFYVVKDSGLNAFAGPGGHIFIFSGLIEAADGIDELAAVLCHEIAHVSARHLAQRIEQNKKIGLATLAGALAGALIGGKAGGAVMSGSVAAGIQAQLHYSRNDERQADQLGFKYMDAAGFDPSGMITILQKIEKSRWVGTEKVPSYLLTHPTGPERMSDLDTMLSGHTFKSGKKEAAKSREAFPFFKTLVRTGSTTPTEAEQVFKRELDKDPDSTLAHFGLGIAFKERSEYNLAIEHFQKALQGEPESLPILKNLGETYILNDQDKEGIATLEKALKIDNQDKSALFVLAKSYQDLEEYAKAIPLYEKLTLLEPVKDEVFHNLGVSFGREGKLPLAHYYFGVYFKRSGNWEKARFHLRKAAELSGNDPTLRNRIQRAMEDLPLK